MPSAVNRISSEWIFESSGNVMYRNHDPFPYWKKVLMKNNKKKGKYKGFYDVYYQPPNSLQSYSSLSEIKQISKSLSLPSSLALHEWFDFSKLFCLCHDVEYGPRTLVECSCGEGGCNGWFHLECVGHQNLSQDSLADTDLICTLCANYLESRNQLEAFKKDLEYKKKSQGFPNMETIIFKENYAKNRYEVNTPAEAIKSIFITNQHEEVFEFEEFSSCHTIWGLISYPIVYPPYDNQVLTSDEEEIPSDGNMISSVSSAVPSLTTFTQTAITSRIYPPYRAPLSTSASSAPAPSLSLSTSTSMLYPSTLLSNMSFFEGFNTQQSGFSMPSPLPPPLPHQGLHTTNNDGLDFHCNNHRNIMTNNPNLTATSALFMSQPFNPNIILNSNTTFDNHHLYQHHPPPPNSDSNVRYPSNSLASSISNDITTSRPLLPGLVPPMTAQNSMYQLQAQMLMSQKLAQTTKGTGQKLSEEMKNDVVSGQLNRMLTVDRPSGGGYGSTVVVTKTATTAKTLSPVSTVQRPAVTVTAVSEQRISNSVQMEIDGTGVGGVGPLLLSQLKTETQTQFQKQIKDTLNQEQVQLAHGSNPNLMRNPLLLLSSGLQPHHRLFGHNGSSTSSSSNNISNEGDEKPLLLLDGKQLQQLSSQGNVPITYVKPDVSIKPNALVSTHLQHQHQLPHRLLECNKASDSRISLAKDILPGLEKLHNEYNNRTFRAVTFICFAIRDEVILEDLFPLAVEVLQIEEMGNICINCLWDDIILEEIEDLINDSMVVVDNDIANDILIEVINYELMYIINESIEILMMEINIKDFIIQETIPNVFSMLISEVIEELESERDEIILYDMIEEFLVQYWSSCVLEYIDECRQDELIAAQQRQEMIWSAIKNEGACDGTRKATMSNKITMNVRLIGGCLNVCKGANYGKIPCTTATKTATATAIATASSTTQQRRDKIRSVLSVGGSLDLCSKYRQDMIGIVRNKILSSNSKRKRRSATEDKDNDSSFACNEFVDLPLRDGGVRTVAIPNGTGFHTNTDSNTSVSLHDLLRCVEGDEQQQQQQYRDEEKKEKEGKCIANTCTTISPGGLCAFCMAPLLRNNTTNTNYTATNINSNTQTTTTNISPNKRKRKRNESTSLEVKSEEVEVNRCSGSRLGVYPSPSPPSQPPLASDLDVDVDVDVDVDMEQISYYIHKSCLDKIMELNQQHDDTDNTVYFTMNWDPVPDHRYGHPVCVLWLRRLVTSIAIQVTKEMKEKNQKYHTINTDVDCTVIGDSGNVNQEVDTPKKDTEDNEKELIESTADSNHSKSTVNVISKTVRDRVTVMLNCGPFCGLCGSRRGITTRCIFGTCTVGAHPICAHLEGWTLCKLTNETPATASSRETTATTSSSVQCLLCPVHALQRNTTLNLLSNCARTMRFMSYLSRLVPPEMLTPTLTTIIFTHGASNPQKLCGLPITTNKKSTTFEMKKSIHQ
eukprot:gene3917-7811_t